MNNIGGIDVIEDDHNDNLAIALATYFESRLDCPIMEPDENGWNPWAVEMTNNLLDRIVQTVKSE